MTTVGEASIALRFFMGDNIMKFSIPQYISILWALSVTITLIITFSDNDNEAAHSIAVLALITSLLSTHLYWILKGSYGEKLMAFFNIALSLITVALLAISAMGA